METLKLNVDVPWAKFEPVLPDTYKVPDSEDINDNFHLQLQSYENTENPVKKKQTLDFFSSNPYLINYIPITASNNDMVKYFRSKGLSEVQARGLVGNLMFESGGGISNIIQGGKRGSLKVDGKTGYGLAQWTAKTRQENLHKFANTYNPSTQQQLDFIWWELNNTHKAALEDLKKQVTIEGSTRSVMNHYEAPDPSVANFNKRVELAKQA